MGNIIPNSFTSYDLTPEEVQIGSIFTGLQKQVLQNYLATYAEERLQLDFDPLNPHNFAQQEAEKKGVIQFIQYILQMSDTAAEEQAAERS